MDKANKNNRLRTIWCWYTEKIPHNTFYFLSILLLFLLAIIIFVPFLNLLYSAFFDEYPKDLYHHLFTTVLPNYLWNSIFLSVLTGILTIIWGVTSAWLLTQYQFLFSKVFAYVLILPFAIPSYIVAYAYTDFFDYSGPVQSLLRNFFGWESPKDYFFPKIRSIGGCAWVLSLNLYTYIYMLTRTAFLEQPKELSQNAKLFGLNEWQRFTKISFPLAKPAIMIGLCVIFMEILSDFVTVEYFSIPTISLGAYNVWFHMDDAPSAIRIAAIGFCAVGIVMFIEKYLRRKQEQYIIHSRATPTRPHALKGLPAFFAIFFLGFTVFCGFIFPFLFICYYAFPNILNQWNTSWLTIILNSVSLTISVEMVIFFFVIMLLFSVCLNSSRKKKRLKIARELFSFGYAMPGTLLALGILTFSSFFSKMPNDFLNIDISSIKSYLSVVYAQVLHYSFIPIALMITRLENIGPQIEQTIRLYGISKRKVIKKVYFPLLRRAFLTGILIVFIESIKEVPATLILRPFNFDTIATSLYSYISDEAIEQAAFPSLIILILSLIPVAVLSSQINKNDERHMPQ